MIIGKKIDFLWLSFGSSVVALVERCLVLLKFLVVYISRNSLFNMGLEHNRLSGATIVFLLDQSL